MRQITSINADWIFIKENISADKAMTANGDKVNIPHTWNNLDGQDGGGDYIRDKFWYRKELNIEIKENKKYFIEFEGVSCIANVYVNNTHVGEHIGGFSTFRFDITNQLKNGQNTILVQADNTVNQKTYPQVADFTFFGGIYRNVNIIEVADTHFDLEYCGAPGIQVTPVLNENGTCDINVKSFVSNIVNNLTIKYSIYDAENNLILEDTPSNITETNLTMENPHLWNGIEDPYLYKAVATLYLNGVAIDEVSANFGVRSFEVDPNKGFILNGKPYSLRGVSRHQDRQDMGWALTTKEHDEDMELIREVGANTIRLAHYQHDQYFYDLCDKYGMVVWAEIPFISVFMNTEEAKQDTLNQMRELIVQNYNHPSICFWGVSNEITMKGDKDEALIENLNAVNDLAHSLDKTRKTTVANLCILDPASPAATYPDIIAYNHYFGWYMGELTQNEEWIDDYHTRFPDRCLGISEYGAEGILKWHSDDPKVKDYSEEYHALYHEHMAKIFDERPFLWATYVWNMFDFAADNRDEGGVQGRNNKGLITYDRKIKKDAFYIYQAYWATKPMVHICGRRYVNRAHEATTVKVYSNLNSITLFVNGEEFKTLEGNKVFTFENVPLTLGENTISVKAGDLTDEIKLNRIEEATDEYVLKDTAAGGNVENWIDITTGNMLEFPEGYFSIKDTFGNIFENEAAKEVALKALEELNENAEGIPMTEEMLDMASTMTLMSILNFMGIKCDNPQVAKLNEQLNKIQK